MDLKVLLKGLWSKFSPATNEEIMTCHRSAASERAGLGNLLSLWVFFFVKSEGYFCSQTDVLLLKEKQKRYTFSLILPSFSQNLTTVATQLPAQYLPHGKISLKEKLLLDFYGKRPCNQLNSPSFPIA